MCFKFDAWCCFGPGPDHEDYYYVPAKTTTHYPPPLTAQRNGHYHYGHHQGFHANGHRAPHHHLPVTADEQDRKASNDARRGHAPAAGAAAGGQYV